MFIQTHTPVLIQACGPWWKIESKRISVAKGNQKRVGYQAGDIKEKQTTGN